jgi:hypothetical protein
MKVLGIRRLEFIYFKTREQNGHMESFHKTLKKGVSLAGRLP